MLDDSTSARRATMPAGTERFLEKRSLDRDHRSLAAILRPGMSVLDIGCGSGAITRGIAESVGPGGSVLGVDVNEDLLALARAGAGRWPQASFERGDVTRLAYRDAFDVVTAARVLQWLASPDSALRAMVGAAKPGGRIVVLDYNHTKARWEPEPPAAFRRFYAAFMAWRADAGMDNELADHLAGMMRAAGLSDVRLSDESESVSDDDLDFDERIDLWPRVIATRGHQLVADGFLSEVERVTASEALAEWAARGPVRQTLYLRAATAVK